MGWFFSSPASSSPSYGTQAGRSSIWGVLSSRAISFTICSGEATTLEPYWNAVNSPSALCVPGSLITLNSPEVFVHGTSPTTTKRLTPKSVSNLWISKRLASSYCTAGKCWFTAKVAARRIDLSSGEKRTSESESSKNRRLASIPMGSLTMTNLPSNFGSIRRFWFSALALLRSISDSSRSDRPRLTSLDSVTGVPQAASAREATSTVAAKRTDLAIKSLRTFLSTKKVCFIHIADNGFT